MRWHYTEKDEWPENHDTVMVRTLKEFDGIIPAFYVQEQTSPMTKKFYRYDHLDKEIDGVEVWCSFNEIAELLDALDSRENLEPELTLVAQAASGDRIFLAPQYNRELNGILSHDLKIAKNILENDLLPPSLGDPDWPKEHEIDKRKYVRVEVWCDHKMIGWVDNTNGSYETV